jgi:hypothetical protein
MTFRSVLWQQIKLYPVLCVWIFGTSLGIFDKYWICDSAEGIEETLDYLTSSACVTKICSYLRCCLANRSRMRVVRDIVRVPSGNTPTLNGNAVDLPAHREILGCLAIHRGYLDSVQDDLNDFVRQGGFMASVAFTFF